MNSQRKRGRVIYRSAHYAIQRLSLLLSCTNYCPTNEGKLLSRKFVKLQQKISDCIVTAIEICRRDFKRHGYLLGNLERWGMHTGFIAANARTAAALVDADHHA